MRLPGPHDLSTPNSACSRPGTNGELELAAVHVGVAADYVRAATGWELRVGEPLTATEAPTELELRTLRSLRARPPEPTGREGP